MSHYATRVKDALRIKPGEYPSAEDLQEIVCKFAEEIKRTNRPNETASKVLHDQLTEISCELDKVIQQENEGLDRSGFDQPSQGGYYATIGEVDQPNFARQTWM